MHDMEKVILFNKKKFCHTCKCEMDYKHAGIYECPNCGAVDMNEFGKVKTYLDKNGPTPAVILSEDTGVPIAIINDFLRQGKVEIPEGSEVFIKCEKCGADIRYGRYCPECVKTITVKIKGALISDVIGERPKKKLEDVVRPGKQDRMHYLDRQK